MKRTATIDEQGRALLQHRIAAFSAGLSIIMFVGFVGRAFLLWQFPEKLRFVPAGTLALQALAALCPFVMFALMFRRTRSTRFVRVVEALGLLGMAGCFEIIAFTMTQLLETRDGIQRLVADPDLNVFGLFATLMPLISVAFVLTYAMVLRAAFVPTSARHTALLTSAVGVPLLVLGVAIGGSLDSNANTSWIVGGGAFAQWAITVVVCTLVSKVIYGLREAVEQARRLGQYTLDSLVGEGGMGMVYRASHAMLRRPTAIKLLPPERAGAEALERFEREVQLTAQLTHPNTVTIFDYGRTDDGIFYYAMEFLEGATLEDVVRIDGPQAASRVVRIMAQTAGALGEAHGIGLIHRDVKPANIVLSSQGGERDVAKVVDFGLVKDLEHAERAGVSRDGIISGTPLYLAPEILSEPDTASPRSDVYALGAVGYFLLTGEHVFHGNTVIEILGHHLHTEPERPSKRLGKHVPDELESLIMQCLSKDPAKRPQTAAEVRSRLDQCGVEPWTQTMAEDWWSQHEPALLERRDAPHAEEPKAFTIDVRRRRAG